MSYNTLKGFIQLLGMNCRWSFSLWLWHCERPFTLNKIIWFIVYIKILIKHIIIPRLILTDFKSNCQAQTILLTSKNEPEDIRVTLHNTLKVWNFSPSLSHTDTLSLQMNGWCGWIGRSELNRLFELERKEFWHKSGRIKRENSDRNTWCLSSVILLKWTVNLNQRSSRFPPLKTDRWWITHSSVRTRWAGPSRLC